jgi:hypothetical protein
MTTVISLRATIGWAAYFDQPTKNASGILSTTEGLMKSGVPATFRDFHDGIYAFLAFHPILHKEFTEYIASGAASSETGKSVLVLFLAPREYGTATRIDEAALTVGVELDLTTWGAYELVRSALPVDKRRLLPGILLFDADLARHSIIYVPYSGGESSRDVSHFCQTIFGIAEACFLGSVPSPDRYDELSQQLQRLGIDYVRSAQTSFAEWIIGAYRSVINARQDLALLVRTLSQMFK